MSKREQQLLIVDDSPEDRETYRRFLSGEQEYHYVFRYVETGAEGLRVCAAEPPDCLLLDYLLPDLDGLEFLDALGISAGGTNGELAPRPADGQAIPPSLIPIIMLTGQGNEEVAVQALKKGAQDYLVKGTMTAEELRAAVRNAIQRIGLLRRLEEQRHELEGLAHERAQLIADLESRNQELSLAGRRKDEFMAMLAHELRNPLAPIRNAVALLSQAESHNKTGMQNASILTSAREIIDRQAAQLTRLVDDLLDVTRIARGKILIRKERLDLAALVRATVEDHRSVLEGNGLTMTAQIPDGPLWLMGDKARLAQMVGNILRNAAKFTDRGGQVSLSLSCATMRQDASARPDIGSPAVPGQSSDAVLVVRDTGIGMSPELLSRIFEPFCQAESSLSRTQGGLGLGLTLARAIVELHGGEITAASAGLGHGSTFTVHLPLAESSRDRALHTTPATGQAQAGKLRRVLIIEDSRDTAESMKMLFEMLGNEVSVAETGPTGVESAREFHPEVVLCDIGLPVMDGYCVARALKADPRTSSAYLIALTGYGSDEDKARAHEAGFNLHLRKPVSFEELQDVLERLPGARRSP